MPLSDVLLGKVTGYQHTWVDFSIVNLFTKKLEGGELKTFHGYIFPDSNIN